MRISGKVHKTTTVNRYVARLAVPWHQHEIKTCIHHVHVVLYNNHNNFLLSAYALFRAHVEIVEHYNLTA